MLAADRAGSRGLTPRCRADLAGAFIIRAGQGLDRAAAVLAGTPPEQRWATLALLARFGPRPGTPAHVEWGHRASPVTPGLPDPASLNAITGVWSKLVGRSAAKRAAIVAECIRNHAGTGAEWTSVPLLAFPLGAGFRGASDAEAHLVGDPVAIAGTVAALTRETDRDASLARGAAVLGLTGSTLHDLARIAHEVHVTAFRNERRAVEQQAYEDGERVLAAERARLPRGRSPRPPPSSTELRRWILSAPLDLLRELARAARGPAGPLTLRAAMQQAGLAFPDPAGTIGQTVAWYLEERAPALLDMPTFLVRADGMVHQHAPR